MLLFCFCLTLEAAFKAKLTRFHFLAGINRASKNRVNQHISDFSVVFNKLFNKSTNLPPYHPIPNLQYQDCSNDTS